MDNIKSLLSNLSIDIESVCRYDLISDIRIRENYPIHLKTIDNTRIIIDRITSQEEILELLSIITKHSIYAYEDELQNGYLYMDGGVRIGVAGAYNVVKDKLHLKRYSSIVIRVPHAILGVADKLCYICNNYQNTLIISPPGCGKTTLLRDMIRLLSNNYEVLVIDERYEISGGLTVAFDFGNGCDFICGIDKSSVSTNAIRGLAPNIIAMDEIGGRQDLETIRDISYRGVRLLTTMHAESIEDAKNRLEDVLEIFPNIIVLNSIPRVGSIQSIMRAQC